MVVGVTLLAKPVAAEVRQAAEAKVFAPIKAAPTQPRLQAAKVGAPLAQTWSCYAGGRRPCGRCDSCQLRAKGFREAGVLDPA